MSDLMSHIAQAEHNKQCANFLIEEQPQFRDWAITTAFYAAVHFAEACFFTESTIGHSDRTMDRRRDRGEGIHDYRERKIRELASRAHVEYKKLRTASQHARYLVRTGSDSTHQQMMSYYSVSDVQKFIKEDLSKIQNELEKAFGVKLS